MKATSSASDWSEDAAPAPPFSRLPSQPARQRMLEAMLVVSGELGYEQVAVKHVIERAKSSRATFYKNFEDREDCFAQAHEAGVEWLYRRLTGAAKRQPTWREGLRSALAELLEFCANQPEIAKALIVEAHSAGPRALAQRAEFLERLSLALDGARHDETRQQAPPEMTASFIVGAIDTLVCAKLMAGDAKNAPEMLPGLLYFVVLPYCGEDAAWEEMAAAPQAQWAVRRGAASELP